MNRRSSWFGLSAFVAALSCTALAPSAGAIPTTPIAIDPTNPQYFFYDNQTIALVGTSAEYLCHVVQPEKVGYYCTNADYPAFLADLESRGLNKIRLWLGLNHSPGTQLSPSHQPYTFEQPFVYLGGGIWDWDNFSQPYFDAVKGVIQSAANHNIIVEVVLFDPWSGDWTLGPWNTAHNNRGKGFTSRNKFVTGAVTAGSQDDIAQQKQLEFVRRIATELNGFHNFYWEIANEPDLLGANSALAVSAITAWHGKMITELRNKELTLPNGVHLIAVDYHTDTALGTVAANPLISIVSGHYVAVADYTSPTRPRFGALELENNWQAGPLGTLNKLFGFNETRITPFETTIRGARAEAWEFMLKEGGSYDHYGYDWQLNTNAQTIRTQLGKLGNFLRGLDLRNFARATGAAPFWASGLGTYGAGNKYWSAMQKVRHQYAIYIHHSTIDFTLPSAPTTPTNFSKYVPATGTYSENLNVALGSIAGTFLAEWVDPATGNTLSSIPPIIWNPAIMSSVNLVSPSYSFDIALRIKRQP